MDVRSSSHQAGSTIVKMYLNDICITTEKWEVLMSIKKWRNKYIGHPKTGIMLADSAFVEILKLAKQFHDLYGSSEIYYDELNEISKCKSIRYCLYYRASLAMYGQSGCMRLGHFIMLTLLIISHIFTELRCIENSCKNRRY